MSMFETGTARLASDLASANVQSPFTSQAAAENLPTAMRLPPAPGPSPLSPLTSLVPPRLSQLTGVGQDAQLPAFDPNFQRNLQSLGNKYAELAGDVNLLPEPARRALMKYDSNRVAQGGSPMTREQTLGAIDTILNNQPTTPGADRSPTDFLGNLQGDLSDIVKTIPRLPFAIASEIGDLPNISQRIQENRDQGMNQLAAVLNAPGVRMAPGAFVAGQLAQGTAGARELATHPLMAFLDVLPVANKAAGGTQVGRLATQAAEQAGRRPRALTALVTGKVLRDADGNLVPAASIAQHQGVVPSQQGGLAGTVDGLGRNAWGQALDIVRTDTRLGQALESFGGRRSREVSGDRGTREQRYRVVMEGHAKPENIPEHMATDANRLFRKYEDTYEHFKTDKAHRGPEWDAQRAEFWQKLQRDPSSLDPGFVGEYRELMHRAAKHQEAQGNLGLFDGEWYDPRSFKSLTTRQANLDNASNMFRLSNEYLSPSGTMTPAAFTADMQRIAQMTSRKTRGKHAWALENTLDAYGYNIEPLRSVRHKLGQGKATPESWVNEATRVIEAGPQIQRRSMQDIIAALRTQRRDVQAGRLQDAVARGDRAHVTRLLKSLYSRKNPWFNETDFPGLRDDIVSMARRYDFFEHRGGKITEAAVDRAAANLERARNKNAPARFHGLLADEVRSVGTQRLTDAAEVQLGRKLTDTEAGQLASALYQRRWDGIPGVDDAAAIIRGVEREVTQTWRQLREAGADPVFVHKVTPGRANTAFSGNINPVPVQVSQAKQRVLDLSPSVQDIQVSVRHQFGEVLQKEMNEAFVTQVIDRVGVREADLRSALAREVEQRMMRNPSLDFEGTLQSVINQRFEKFNPEQAGHSWGGVKLDKFRQEAYYIPKAIASNLHQYAKPPSLFTSITDPITKAFRYSVIGLSPSIILNNFFSNSVAVMAKSGPGVFKHWSKAREWLADPSKIPDETLKGIMLADHPQAQYLNRDAWLASETGQKFVAGSEAATRFAQSAGMDAVRKGKSFLDGVVDKSMRLQQLGDNVYRAMQYMEEVEKAARKGASPEAASAKALEAVRTSLIDYASFTPIERSAMRTLIPFYSYMGHAARFIMRYPFDHPMRVAITARIADAERERLGALPASYLGMIPLPGFLGGGVDDDGKQTFLTTRLFDPFGDLSDMTSVQGWVAAMNPLIQTGLQQVGVEMGEAELYPTRRWNPDTGRMEATRDGNLLLDLFHNAVPRAELFTAAAGLSPRFNAMTERDPDSAGRVLASMAGIPRVWREMDPYTDMAKGEVARQTTLADVLSQARRSGDWSEAMRYPTGRAQFALLQAMPPEAFEALAPAERDEIVEALSDAFTGG